jgi:DNA-dependent protein kinase catalytic subunit
VTFLSGEISSRETKYRKECMALLFDFVKLLPESRDSGAVWLASKPKSFLRDMTEKNLARFIDDVSIELLSSNEGLLCVLSFFESLTASLESLGWLLRHSFISDIKVVLKSHESTSVFRGINRLMREFGSDSNAVPALRSLTPAEQSRYRLLCAQAVLRVFRFLLLLIEKEPQWFGESKLVKEVLFGSDDFFRRLFECILDPTTASAGNDELFKSFPVYTSSLVKHLEMTKDQHAILERTLVAHNVFLLNPADPKVNLVAGSTLCAGLQRLSDLVKDKLKQPARAYVLDQSVQFSSSGVLTPAQSLLATEMLSLSLDLDCVTPKEVIQLLLRTDSIAGAAAVADGSPSSTSSVAARRSVGSLWYEAFQAPIDKFLLSHWERLGGIVVTQMRSNVVMMSVVFSLLKKCGSRPRISAPKALPVCKYGALCYRLSASHRAKYFHPSSSGGDSEEASQQQRQIEGVRAEQQEEEHWTEKFKSGFMNLICEHVEELAVWTRPEADQRSKECLMDLVSEMLRLDAHRVLLPRSKSRQFCAAVAEKFLARPLPLSFKNRAMKFVGPLLKMLPDQEVFGIMEGLRSVTVYDFPVKSTDLVDGSPAYNEYIVSIETLLTLLRESCNMRILELLYPVLRDTDHRHAERIHHFLMLFVNSLDEENCKMVFRMCYQTLMDPTQPHMLQYVLVTRLCVPILLRSEPDVVLDLFLDYVLQLVENIPTDANITSSRRAEPGPAKRHAGGEGAGAGGSVSVEHNLVVQVCSFDLLREFYKLVPRALIHGQVNEKYCSSLDSKKKLSGNELTIRVSSAAYNAKVTTHHVGHGIRPELLRQYHQSAFNCLAAVVICTQTKEDLYANLLLEEKSKKGEFFWANVIDTTVVWTFEVSTNYLVLRKPVSEVRPENDLMLGGSLSMNHAERRTLLIERFLGSSSLEPSSQSGSNAAGFWSSSVMAGGGGGGRGGIAGGRGVGDGNLRGSDSVGFSLALSDDDSAVKTAVAASANVRGIPLSKVAEEYEFDVVNSNPCMPTMLHVIDVLFEKNKYSDHGSMPVWMSNLVRVMENSSLHPNVRLFVGKIFVNRMELFAPWGQKHLLGPLLRLCVTTESMATVRSMQGEESAVTYYVRDLCIMMLRFGKPSRDLRALTTQFVTWFIKKIPSKNSAVLKENVRLFSFFYRQWEDCFDLDKTLLIAMLKQSHATWGVMMRAVGLRLTSLIMESRRLPIEPADCRRDPELDEMEFYRSLVANLDHKSLRIYAAAAEVCGELVSALNHADSDSAPRFSNSVREVVMAMFARKELDRAVVVLQQLAEKCPEFVDGFFGKLFDCLGTLTGEFKLAALEIVQKRSEVVPNLMPQLRGHLIPLLENRDARTQLLALQLALSLLNRMDDAFLSQVVAALSVFPTHQSVECRRKAYQLLMAIWGGRAHLREDRTLRVALLKGLSDPEEKKHILPNVQYTPEEKEKILNEKTISEMMLAFWTSKDMLTEGCMDRLEEMLSLLYEPEVERDWLSFAPAMLLKLSLDKKDYVQQKLFDYPLEQGAQFVEVKINTSSVVSTGGVGGGGGGGGGGSLPYTPAFSAGSQDSEYLSMDAFVSSARTDGQKRATAAFGEIVWTPSMSVSNDPAVVPKKSMLKGVFKMNDLPGQPQASVPKDVAFGQISVDDKNTVYRRFRKPTATLSSSFDMTAHLKRKQQVAVEKRVLESILAGMVPLSRTYLMGELPNIGISMEDFLVPMCQIAARDHAFASALLALVIDGAITALPSSQREQRQESLRGLISSCLSQTTQCNGAFVSCLLRVCYSHTGLVIDDLLVGNVALKSSSYHSGAMVLEKQIDYRRKNAPKQAASKRRKKEDSHLEAAVGAEPGWKPLAALFKVLGDDDVLTGICDKQLAQHSYTHDAIFKELQGDYGGALAVYNQGAEAAADATFDWKGNVPLLDELNLWEDGRLECLTHLTRWSELAASAKTEADFNLDNLWSPDLESYRQIFVQAAFRQRDQWQDLAQFVDDALSKPERGEWLLKNFGTQLAMMSMIRDDLDQAKSLISKSMKNVLESWRSLHPLARNGRLRLVQSLQQLKEIEEVVTFVRDEKNFSSMKALEGLLQRWEVRWPRETTSIVVWDSVAYCRSLLLDKVQQRFANSHQLERQHQQYGMQWPGQASQESVESAIADARVSYWRKCMRAGMKQHNLEVAKTFHNLCNEAEAVRRSLPSSELQSSLNDLPSLCLAIKLEEKRSWHLDSPEAQVRSICNSIVGLQSTSAASDELLAAVPRNFLQYHRLIAKLYLTLFDFLKANKGPILADLVKLACRERVIPETENGNLDGAVRSCLSTAYRHLNSAYRNAAKDLSVEYTAKTYMHMGRFCDRMLDENSKRTAESRAKYAKHVVEPILAAMALGSREASDMVPKVLVLLSNNRTPMMQAAFEKGVEVCQPWMFIRWISFLLSNLSDSWMAERVLPLLTKIAKDYPLAVYYPFNLSSDVKFLSKESQKLVMPLRKALHFPALEQLMFHLMLLQHPEHRFGDWLGEVKRMRKKKEDAALLEDWRKFYDLTLDVTNNLYGAYNAKFANMYLSKILKLVGGEDGRELVKKSLDERALNDLLSKAKDSIPNRNSTRKEDLILYSKYLADYDYTLVKSSDRSLMEIPGQYANLTGKPDPESHIRISSFGDKVLEKIICFVFV